MKNIQSPEPTRFGLSRYLTLAIPLGLAGAGLAIAQTSPPEPDSRAATIETPEVAAAAASQRGQERMGRRSRRGPSNREGRAFRNGRRDGRLGAMAHVFGRRMATELGLTDEQRDQMRQAMRDMGDNRRDSRRQIADAQRFFRQAARDPERTSEEIQALGESLGRARADAVLRQRTDRERIAGILTEEQRAALDQRWENREDGRSERRERRRRRG